MPQIGTDQCGLYRRYLLHRHRVRPGHEKCAQGGHDGSAGCQPPAPVMWGSGVNHRRAGRPARLRRGRGGARAVRDQGDELRRRTLGVLRDSCRHRPSAPGRTTGASTGSHGGARRGFDLTHAEQSGIAYPCTTWGHDVPLSRSRWVALRRTARTARADDGTGHPGCVSSCGVSLDATPAPRCATGMCIGTRQASSLRRVSRRLIGLRPRLPASPPGSTNHRTESENQDVTGHRRGPQRLRRPSPTP